MPRELFLPPRYRHLAYEDRAVEIGLGQSCSQPWVVALVIEALALEPGSSVLEVGVGSGYLAAVLRGAGAAKVVGLELLPYLAARARSNLNRAGIEGVVVLARDGAQGATPWAPYDAVVVSAAADAVPEPVRGQLKQGGRLVIPLRERAGERLWCLTREADGWSRRDLGECRFVPLRGATAGGAPP